MNRRSFVQTASAAGLGALVAPRAAFAARKLDRIGLELYSLRHAMAADPERTLAAVRAIGFTDVELLWSFDNFNRTPQQVRDALNQNGLRAPSAHVNPEIMFVGWQRSIDTAKMLGMQYIIVPSFSGATSQTLDDWRQWADHFNHYGAIARKSGIWLAFHNEPDHMKPIDGRIPYDVFVERTDPSVVRLQLDVGNMLMGGGDPMAYLGRHRNRYHSFHLKDVLPDRSSDTELGKGTFDFRKFLAAVPNLSSKPAYIEQENGKDELASARMDYDYLRSLDF
jgi:sugar phosphate isomerase/epimerase